MSQWVAEITNNLDKDYDVYVELLEDDEYKARLEMSSTAQFVLRVYNTDKDVSLPIDWLLQIIDMASSLSERKCYGKSVVDYLPSKTT